MKVVSEDVKVVADEVQVEKRRKILEWLSPGSFNSRHEELQKSRVKSSGQWFLNSNEYINWVSGTGPSCLLCTGIRSTL